MKEIAIWLVLLIVASALLAIPVMLLWNWLMPYIFGLPTVTMLQALGLTVLFKTLFGSSSSSSKG